MLRKSIFAFTFMLALSAYSHSANAMQITISTTGMVCRLCAQKITTALSALDGVQSVKADQEKGLIVLHLLKGVPSPTDEVLKNTISGAGFAVSDIQHGAED